MTGKNFLIPLGTAVAALLPAKVQAAVNVSGVQTHPGDAVRVLPSVTPTDIDRVIQELTYRSQSELHSLLLRQPSAGPLYAGHGSHVSHASHHSHMSHRSGY